MSENNQPTGCVTCPILRREGEPHRVPHRLPVCDGDRWTISRHLADIDRLHRDLLNPEPAEFDNRKYEHRWHVTVDDQQHEMREWRRADPLAAVGGVAPIPSRNRQPSVSGSREKPVPVRLDVLDLTGPARRFNPTRDAQDRPHQRPSDAAGHLSVASILDSWVRDWRDTLWPDQHLPAATVADMAGWLRAGADEDNPGVRIDEACDRHPAIDEFAADVKALRGALRSAAGETEPPQEDCDGVECQRCSLRLLKWRTDGIDGVECTNPACLRTFTREEYTTWVRRLGGYERSQRTDEEVVGLLRRGPMRRAG